MLALMVGVAPAAAGVLDGVVRIAVSVDVEHPVEGIAAAALERRLTAFLADLAPALAPDAAAPDRLRLTVAVRPHSSSALRGFYLPFSGTYAIGTVRLGVERAVHLSGGAPRTVPAIVWQRERVVATRWAAAGAAVEGAVMELLDALRSAGLDRR
ncbi:MAG: hypothetical protein WED01_09045 [Candidatus Rokuibacteriota bacterium]